MKNQANGSQGNYRYGNGKRERISTAQSKTAKDAADLRNTKAARLIRCRADQWKVGSPPLSSACRLMTCTGSSCSCVSAGAADAAGAAAAPPPTPTATEAEAEEPLPLVERAEAAATSSRCVAFGNELHNTRPNHTIQWGRYRSEASERPRKNVRYPSCTAAPLLSL